MDTLSVQFYGDFGNSNELKANLKQTISPANTDFLNDLFHFHSLNADMGHIFKIKLKQTLQADLKKIKWYLEKIKISYDKDCFIFPYQKWINLDKDQKKVEIKLYEKVK